MATLEKPTASDVALPLEDRFGRFGLSRQESRVLSLAMSGHIDKQIADQMGISLGTVRVYWKRIRQKTGGTRSETIASLAKRDSQSAYDEVRERCESLTRKLAAREVLERHAALFETTFGILREPVAILEGATFVVRLANPAFAAVFGAAEDEMVGRPFTDWTSLPTEMMGEDQLVGVIHIDGSRALTYCGERSSVFVVWGSDDRKGVLDSARVSSKMA